MTGTFDVKQLEQELKILYEEFINNENLKNNPKNSFDRIISRSLININGKKTLLSSLANITLSTVNNVNILRVTVFEKVYIKNIESGLLNEFGSTIIERIDKENNILTIYLPTIITQFHIDTAVNLLFKPIIELYSTIKLKDIRNKYQDMIKPLQIKQRDMFNKNRESIDTESQKYTKKVNDFVTSLYKKYNIKV